MIEYHRGSETYAGVGSLERRRGPMSMQFRLPDLGEGVKEGQVIKVLVKPGDAVMEDQPLMEVETDKAAVEIPSPYAATITKIHAEEGRLVYVGDVMFEFESADAVGSPSQTGSAKQASSPSAEANADRPPTGASGTPGGRDVTVTAAPPRHGRRKPASPAVRKLARRLGIDLQQVEGSGPGGRVTRADVESAGQHGGSTASPPAATSTAPSDPVAAPAPPAAMQDIEGEADQDQHGPIVRQPLTQARKTIAGNMAQAWSSIPHVTDSDDADVTDLDTLRRGYAAPENGGRKVTMLAFVVRAVARALRAHPVFNAHFDESRQQIVYKKYINIAVGVHTERGLVAPVIRGADRLGVIQIADELDRLSEQARTGSFAISDTRGGTYTISNAGAFGGSHYSTPIITPGQAAVLAIGRSRRMPWVVGDAITPRLIMPLSHSFDHRLADGGEEITFLQTIIGALENPARMLL